MFTSPASYDPGVAGEIVLKCSFHSNLLANRPGTSAGAFKPGKMIRLMESGLYALAIANPATWYRQCGMIRTWFFSSEEHLIATMKDGKLTNSSYRQTCIFGINFSWPTKA